MAKRRDITIIRENKREQLTERTARVLNVSLAETEALLSCELTQSVRVNPLAGDVRETLGTMKRLGWVGEPAQWSEHCYTVDQGFEELRDSPLVEEGKIYIQNEASWLPVALLEPKENEDILDVCAAPGGKTSHIAAVAGNSARLIANDNSRPRLAKLQRNMERLHATAEYTLYDATRLAQTMENRQFDRILLDAPCSGEGLINVKEPKTLDTWSVAHIRRLQTLQKRIISQAWQLLKPGGRLVYSTCTMAPEEDEMVIDWLLKRQQDAHIIKFDLPINDTWPTVREWNDKKLSQELDGAIRLAPGSGREAFFACAIEKAAT